ncbi:UNVERIFIED_CONTAM: hypothetical protein GTU68_062183 [Idotea baltica]|nr:hypothetical protein [Idotea baltica]
MSYPGVGPPGSSPYPPSQSAPYPPQMNSSMPYPQANAGPYPPQPGSSPYPPQPGSSPYPPQPGSSPYPPQPGSSPYPPQPGSSPYPPQPGSSPYPPQPGSSPYPPAAGAAPYPPQGNLDSAPYPPMGGSSPYPPNPGAYPPMPQQNSPYPPPASNYPNAAPGAPFQAQQVHNTSASQSYSQTTHSVGGSMWPYTERPTIRPTMSFDPSSDAAQLRKAMKGFGTDEATLIRILGRRTSQERQQILLKYQQSFGRDLVNDLKSELSGNFCSVIVALMTPLHLFLAHELHNAIKGIGTNEKTLIEILCSNDNNALRNIKTSYQTTFGKPIEADIRSDTSGDFGRLMVAMAAAFRDEGGDPSLAPGLAQALYKAGAQKMGTNESEFQRILSCYSYPLLRCVFQEYVKVSGGKTFEAAIKSELSGDFREGMLALYDSINNRAAFFARYLHESMKGFGTKDNALVRLVVSRVEIDMGNIKDEYSKIYGKRLEDAVAGDISGDYKKMILALIQG